MNNYPLESEAAGYRAGVSYAYNIQELRAAAMATVANLRETIAKLEAERDAALALADAAIEDRARLIERGSEGK